MLWRSHPPSPAITLTTDARPTMVLRCPNCSGTGEIFSKTSDRTWCGCRDCQITWLMDRPDPRSEMSRSAALPSTQPVRSWRPPGALIAVLGALGALGVRAALDSVLPHSSPYILLGPVVMITAWYGGPWTALLAAAIG